MFNSQKPTVRKPTRQKLIIVGASVATLIASGNSTPNSPSNPEPNSPPDFGPESVPDGASSGDVMGGVSANNDVIILGQNSGAGEVDAGDGDDIIQGGDEADNINGGAGNDLIYGGAGADQIYGGKGTDHIVVIGTTEDAAYKLADLQLVAFDDVELIQVVDLATINNHLISDVVPGEIINGGQDGAFLYVFGEVDFNGVALSNISKIYMDNLLVISNASLKDLIDQGLTEITGRGVIKAENELLDLDGVKVSPQIDIHDKDGNVIIPVAAEDALGAEVSIIENSTLVGTFEVTDESAVGDVTYTLVGIDANKFNINNATGEISFKAAPDFENAQDSGSDNVFNITVIAKDEHQRTLVQDIAVKVTDVAQPTLYVANEFSPNGSAFLVNQVVFGDQSSPSSTQLNNGNYVVTWYSRDALSDDDDGLSIRAQIFDKNHVRVGEELLVNSIYNSDQAIPQVAALANGGFAITWESFARIGEDSVGSAVKLQIFDQMGVPIGDEVLVNSEVAGDQSYPVIAGLENGGFVIVWKVLDPAIGDGSETAIKGQRYGADGAPVGGEFLVNNEAQDNQKNASVSALDGGGFIVTWASESTEDDDDFGHGIKARIYDENGDAVAGEFLVNNLHKASQAHSQVIQLENGNLVFVWDSQNVLINGVGHDAIKARIFTDAGVAIEVEFLVNSTTDSDQKRPFVSALPEGGFVILWSNEDNSILGQTYDATGQKVDGEFNVSNQESHVHIDLATLNTSGFIVHWGSSDGFGADQSDYAILGQAYELAPIYKYTADASHAFDIVATASHPNSDAAIDNVIISNIPEGISFNHGTLVDDVLTLTAAQLADLEISIVDGMNDRYELTLSVSYVNQPDADTASVTIALSIGFTVDGDENNNALDANAGFDHVNGFEGLDTLTFNGDLEDFSFALVGNDIEVNETGTANIDLIHSIERFIFNDANFDVHTLDDDANIFDMTSTEYDIWLTTAYQFEVA